MADTHPKLISTIAAATLLTAYSRFRSRAEDGPAAPAQFGLSTLVCPPKPEVDIVFVHGLETDSKAAWSEATSNGGEFCWPKAELPGRLEAQHHIQARITVYDYDSKLRTLEYLTRRTLLHQAVRLIEALAKDRCDPEDCRKQLPIVFVCHSVGGLLVKNALVSARASGESQLRDVYDSTAGIVFLGTPHDASPTSLADRLWHIVDAHMLSNKSFNRNELKERCVSLAYSLERFKPLATNLRICVVKEPTISSKSEVNLRVRTNRPSLRYLVASRTHKSLCKFSNPNDRDLMDLISSIGDICTGAKTNPRPKKPPPSSEPNLISGPACDLGMDEALQKSCTSLPEKEDSDELVRLQECLDRWSNGPPPTDASHSDTFIFLRPLALRARRWVAKWMTEQTISASDEYPWPIYVLQGPSGSGKTETALRYVAQNSHKYASVLWVNATNRKSIELSFRQIARRIQNHCTALPMMDQGLLEVLNSDRDLDNEDFYTIVQVITEWLTRPAQNLWLLVLDSLSPESEYPTTAVWSSHMARSTSKDSSWRTLLSLIPSTANGRGHIIISTREGAAVLEPMTIKFSTRLSADDKISSAIPMHVVENFHLEVGSWWKTAQVWEQDVLVATLFLCTKDCPGVPLSLLGAHLEDGGRTVNLRIPQLRRRGALVYPSSDVLQDGTNLLNYIFSGEKDKENRNNRANNVVERSWRLLYDAAMQIPKGPGLIHDWDAQAQLVKNMSSLLERCKITPHITERTHLEKGQCARLAHICENHADYKAAAALYELERKEHKPRAEEEVGLLLNCARVYQLDGDFGCAREACENLEKLVLDKQSEASTAQRIAVCRQFALVTASERKFGDAAAKMLPILELEDPFGSDANNKDVIRSIGELATYLAKKGDRAAASAMFQRMLVSLEETRGAMHPATLSAMEALSAIKLKRGEAEDANRLLSRVHSYQSQRLGQDHPSTVLCESKMAVALELEGNTQEAERKYTKCLDDAIRTLGLRHPFVFRIRENLYRFLRSQGREPEAQWQLDKLKAETQLFPNLYSKAAVQRINYFQDTNADPDSFDFESVLSTRHTMGVGGGYAESEYDTDEY